MKGEKAIFIGFDNETIILSEAQRLGMLKEKKASKPEKEEEKNKMRKKQEEYLNAKLIKAERKKPYNDSKRKLFEGGTIDTIINQADRSRIIYSLFSNSKI